MNVDEQRRVRVLAVLPDQQDRRDLEEIFKHSNWNLKIVDTYREAVLALASRSYGVVITEGSLGSGRDWKHILEAAMSLPVAVPVVVADRLADERLWAEVLNLRGFDLLVTPFDGTEVYRVVSSAWLFWRHTYRSRASASPLSPRVNSMGASSRSGEDQSFTSLN